MFVETVPIPTEDQEDDPTFSLHLYLAKRAYQCLHDAQKAEKYRHFVPIYHTRYWTVVYSTEQEVAAIDNDKNYYMPYLYDIRYSEYKDITDECERIYSDVADYICDYWIDDFD